MGSDMEFDVLTSMQFERKDEALASHKERTSARSVSTGGRTYTVLGCLVEHIRANRLQ
jgi:hypothetical protein